MKPNVTCPSCGKIAIDTATKYGWRSDCCGLWSWGGAPLVDKATHDARKRAHQLLEDATRWATKGELYRILSRKLKIPPEKCHMKIMDVDTCNRVIALLEERVQ